MPGQSAEFLWYRLKPGRLTSGEMEVIRRHPVIAYDILSPNLFLKDALLADRTYRRAWNEQRVLGPLIEERVRHFDPVVVGVFLEVVRASGL